MARNKRPTPTVLVIDPDFRSRAKLSLAAESAGYRVVAAASCAEATTLDVGGLEFIVLDAGFTNLDLCGVVATYSMVKIIVSTRGRELEQSSLPFVPVGQVSEPDELHRFLSPGP